MATVQGRSRVLQRAFRTSIALWGALVLPSTQPLTQTRWASKKQGGSTQNRGGSLPKMLGVKLFGGQLCKSGDIIVRQRGTQVHPGAFVGVGRDHTLYALKGGHVQFSGKKKASREGTTIDHRVIDFACGETVPKVWPTGDETKRSV